MVVQPHDKASAVKARVGHVANVVVARKDSVAYHPHAPLVVGLLPDDVLLGVHHALARPCLVSVIHRHVAQTLHAQAPRSQPRRADALVNDLRKVVDQVDAQIGHRLVDRGHDLLEGSRILLLGQLIERDTHDLLVL
jgi:hypothetical protein